MNKENLVETIISKKKLTFAQWVGLLFIILLLGGGGTAGIFNAITNIFGNPKYELLEGRFTKDSVDNAKWRTDKDKQWDWQFKSLRESDREQRYNLKAIAHKLGITYTDFEDIPQSK